MVPQLKQSTGTAAACVRRYRCNPCRSPPMTIFRPHRTDDAILIQVVKDGQATVLRIDPKHRRDDREWHGFPISMLDGARITLGPTPDEPHLNADVWLRMGTPGYGSGRKTLVPGD